MAESYFKDPLLAKLWEEADGGFRNVLLRYRPDIDAIEAHASLYGSDRDRLAKLLRAELSGARRARERATAIVERDTATEFQEGRFNAAREILEAFDGE